MKCENCGKDHDGSYGSGRFCSNKCARGFSTKEKRDIINKKVSLKLGGSGLSHQEKIQRSIAEKHASYIRETEAKSIMDLSKRTIRKVLARLDIPCSNCGWHVTGVASDIHHIIERCKGGTDDMDNLSYICPNCHRLVHAGILESEKLVNMQDYIGNTWKKYYYVKNEKLFEGSVPDSGL